MALEHEPTVGPPTWRVMAALGLVGLLLAALVAVNGRGVGDVSVAAASREPVDEPAAEPASSSAVPSAPVSAPKEGIPADVARVDRDLEAALSAWGVFAATGDLAAVDGVFAADGPQYAQLQSEVADRLANAPGLPAFDFTMAEAEVVTRSPTAVVLRGDVVVQRVGLAAESYRWDVELRWDGTTGRWLLWTVSAAGA